MKTLRTGASITIGSVELIPIEVTVARAEPGGGRVVATAAKEPTAIVVVSGTRRWAIDMDGREAPLDALVRDVPGLRERMDGSGAGSG